MKITFYHEDELYSIDCPIQVREIYFEDFCDFRTEERKYLFMCRPPDLEEDGSNKDAVESWEMPVDDAIKQLVLAVEQLVKGDVREIPFSLPGEDVSQLINSKYRIQPKDDLTITRLYSHLLTIIQEYKPARIPATYILEKGGRRFVIASKPAAEILLNKTGGKLATGHALEILEYQRRYAKALQDKPLEVGNLDFTLGLTEFAILVRQEGERLPWDKTELDDFIRERREFFRDLTLDEVFGVRFFLLNSLLLYRQSRLTGYSGRGDRRRRKRKGRSRTGSGK